MPWLPWLKIAKIIQTNTFIFELINFEIKIDFI